MTEDQRDELLIRLDERVKKVREDQKDLKATMEGDGFGNCQVHADKLEKLESTAKWSQRGVIAGAITLIGQFLYRLVIPTG